MHAGWELKLLRKGTMPMGYGSSSSSRRLRGAINGGDRVEGAPSLSRIALRRGFKLRNDLTALIADDDGVCLRILSMILTSLGVVDCQEVDNGMAVVNLCTGGADFDIIIIDMEMPVLDGPQAARLLRTMGIRTKIVGVSGDIRGQEMLEFLNAGFDAIFEKPITRANLIPILQEIDYLKS